MAQMTPQDFTATYGPLADDIAKATGLDPSVVLGQAAQETGWGNHVSGHNIFGISPGGKVAAYPDIPTAAQAYVDLINGRYAVASKFAKPEQQARAITQLGYNPDPAYGDSVSANASRVRGMRADTAAPSADDLLSRMQTLTGGAKPAAASAAPSADDLLTRMQTLTPATRPAAETAAPDTGSGLKSAPIRLPVPTGMMPTLAPDGPSANGLAVPDGMPSLAGNLPSDTPGTPGPTGSIDRATVGNALAIPPGRYNGTFLPWTADEGTGANGNISLPGFIRQPLQGLVGGIGNALTFNPETNSYGLSPEAQSVALAGANPLRFGTPSAPISLFGQPERDLRAAPLSADFRAHPLAQPIAEMPGMTVRPGAAPGGPSPNAAAVPPGPNAAGAQASTTAQAQISPEDALIAQSQAEHMRYSERQTPGVPDTAIKVPGVEPTKAQMEQTVNAAREIKGLANINTEVSQEAQAVADQHNAARQTFYADVAKSIPDLANADKERGARMEQALTAAWAKKKPANAEPVVELGNKILDGPEGKRDLVVKEVNGVLAKLQNRAGDIETDPELLYGVRKHINDRLSKEAATDDPQVVRAQAVLLALKDKLDKVIEPAAPGFGKAIADFAAASRPIDVMEALQKAEPGLSDTNGRMQYSRVHKLMRDIITSRRPDAALSKWQSLTPDDMAKLWGLHDDLRRVASAEELARAKGSDTAMNAVDIAKEYAKMGGAVLAHGIPFVGPAVRGVEAALAPILSARASRQQIRRGNALLYPDRSGIQEPLP